jgi:hypothetical protein
MKRFVAALALLVACAVPAVANADGAGYGSQPGYTVANSNTVCAGHGAFGAFSGDPGVIHGYVLADKAEGTTLGAETGPANSGLCGNPQN